MGGALAMMAWVVPVTVLNIYKRNRVSHGEEGDDLNAPKFDHLYPPPPQRKIDKLQPLPAKPYILYTQNGRTGYYPVDPFFKGLKEEARTRPSPRLNLETVFEESKRTRHWKSKSSPPADFTDKEEKKNHSDEELFMDAECQEDENTNTKLEKLNVEILDTENSEEECIKVVGKHNCRACMRIMSSDLNSISELEVAATLEDVGDAVGNFPDEQISTQKMS